MAEVKFADLKKAVKEINSMKIEGVETIRTVGIKREAMEDLFLSSIDKASEAGIEDKLSDFIIETNNGILDYREKEMDSPAPAKKEKAPAKKEKAPAKKEKAPAKKEKAPAKKEKAPAKKEKAPAAKAERSCYGHIKGKQSGLIDEALKDGGTVAEIMEIAGVKRARFMSHLKYLRDTCGLTVIFKANKKDDKSLDHYKIKEEEYSKP